MYPAEEHNSFKELLLRYTELLQARLLVAKAEKHPTSQGSITEHIWRQYFEAYLPSRFRVGAGTIIDAHGRKSEQIDCIVYDNTFSPKFFGEYENILHIPAESVHAVFEIKQTVNKKHLRYASKKIASVRTLHRTSAPYMVDGKERPPKELFFIIGGLLATKIDYKDGIKATVFDEALDEIQKEDSTAKNNIDVVLTAFDGCVDYFSAGHPANSNKDQTNGALARGLFRLVRALLAQGTVSAIDLDYYHKNVF